MILYECTNIIADCCMEADRQYESFPAELHCYGRAYSSEPRTLQESTSAMCAAEPKRSAIKMKQDLPYQRYIDHMYLYSSRSNATRSQPSLLICTVRKDNQAQVLREERH
jgi:hypothetical protein